MPETPARFADLLRALGKYEVEYIIVGGVAAGIEGAPVATFDVDIVYRREPANVARLAAALRSIGAYYWEHAPKRLVPDEPALLLAGHHSLQTDLGRLDVLGSIGRGRTFEDLIGHTESAALGDGTAFRVLDLETVIATKREPGRSKDLPALSTLEAALEEVRRSSGT